MQVKIGEVTIAPAKGFKTLGEVAMVNGAVVVTTKEGLLRVEGNGQAVEVAKGKTLVVTPKVARAPQGGAGGGHSGNGLAIAGLGVGGAGVAVGLLGWREAKRADQDAVYANYTAEQWGKNATAAAKLAQDAAVRAGCALNTHAAINHELASPYTPPAGYNCNTLFPFTGVWPAMPVVNPL